MYLLVNLVVSLPQYYAALVYIMTIIYDFSHLYASTYAALSFSVYEANLKLRSVFETEFHILITLAYSLDLLCGWEHMQTQQTASVN